MDSDKIVTFMRFYEASHAYIIKGVLDAHDIPNFLADENLNTINPLYNQCIGGIRLQLFERDVERAEIILKEQQLSALSEVIPEPDTTEEIIVMCPFCKSGNVAVGPGGEKKHSLSTIIRSLLLALYSFPIRKPYHCFNCGQDFKS